MGKFTIVRKKEKWVATWFGNILKLFIFLTSVFIFVKTIQPFLAQTNPVDSVILVIEGYLTDYALEESIQIFNKGNYEYIIITGKPRLKGSFLDNYKNDGEYSAAILVKLGFDSTKIKVVAIDNNIIRDRTYESALAVKDSITQFNKNTINIVSLGCHARRTRLLFEKAIGNDYEIGIIAIQNQQYDPKTWWKSSIGFREVSNEFIAWIYVRFFFYP